eukprot:9485099-Pyramimonas_sp.AAC.1
MGPELHPLLEVVEEVLPQIHRHVVLPISICIARHSNGLDGSAASPCYTQDIPHPWPSRWDTCNYHVVYVWGHEQSDFRHMLGT